MKLRLFILPALFPLLAPPASGAARAASLDRLEAMAFPRVSSVTVDPRLFDRPAPPQEEPLAVWVQFRDKGFRSPAALRAAKAREADALSPRTLRRRTKVLPLEAAVRIGDLPLEPSYVTALTALGARLRAVSRWFNAASIEASPAVVRRVALLPFVHRVVPVVRETRPLIPDVSGPAPSKSLSVQGLDYGPSATQVTQIRVDQLHARGLTGKGVVVGLLDAGFAPFSTEALDHAVILGERDFVDRDLTTFDTASHGTSVLSVLGAFAPGRLIGPAYGASFLLARTEIVEDGIEIRLEEDLWVEGLEWLERRGADVVNSSVGYTDWYSPDDFDGLTGVTTVAADAAVERGVFIANSVGNEGLAGLTVPADGFHVCAVGGVSGSGASWSGSSRGPTADGRIKPDVSAMAVGVRVASSLFRRRILFDSAADGREAPVDFTATYTVLSGRATRTLRLALALKDDATDDVAWIGKPVGAFSGLSVQLVRGGATQELWANDFSAASVLTGPFPDGFGYSGDTLVHRDGGIETTLANRFDIALLLDLSPLLPEEGLLVGDGILVRTTAEFSPLTGIEISILDDLDRTSYTNGNGTSYASPLVAGAAALILEARPGWGPLQVLHALRSTASQASAPDNEVGYGIVDAASALFDSTVPPTGDLDGDSVVGPADLLLFGWDWDLVRGRNETPLGTALRSDLNLDGRIDHADLFLIGGRWGPVPLP